MSQRARSLAALAVFAVCAILLIPLSFAGSATPNAPAKAEVEKQEKAKPAKEKPVAAKAKPASKARKFLPVQEFGGY